jgi:hypothetical protein
MVNPASVHDKAVQKYNVTGMVSQRLKIKPVEVNFSTYRSTEPLRTPRIN